MADQRYTLSLPPEIYEDIKQRAERRGSSIKEVVQQCIKFGLIAFEVSENPDQEIIFRQAIKDGDTNDVIYKDKTLMFL